MTALVNKPVLSSTKREPAPRKKAPLRIKSGVVFADVTTGRAALRKATESGKVVPVVIRGLIVGPGSTDDGISQEFEIQVEALELGEPVDGE